MKKRYVFLCLCLFSTGTLFAQEFRYRLGLNSLFDNLENSTKFEPTRTYAGISLQPEIGVQLGNHAIMAGVSVTQYFGEDTKLSLEDVLLYYQYEKDAFNFILGNYPTSYQYDYPKLFLSESDCFYDQASSGLLLQYNGEKGYVELIADWMYQLQEERDEQFGIYATGERYWGDFFAGASAMLSHNKYDVDDIYLFELSMQDLHVGYDFQPLAPKLDQLKLSTGMLGSQQNMRFNDESLNHDGWDKAFGWYAEATIQWKGFGITDNFYTGKGLMPYYGDLGNDLYWGSPFYQADRYNRLDLFWEYENDFLSIKPMFTVHFTPQQTATQQFIQLAFNLDRVLRKKK